MPARQPDWYLLALLALHGVIPDEVALAVADLYNQAPMNYDTAMGRVHGVINDLIDSGSFENTVDDEEDDDEVLDKRLPVSLSALKPPTRPQLPIEPPSWYICAWEAWNNLREFEARTSS